MPMEHTTHSPQPKSSTIDFLHRLARLYRPQQGIDLEFARFMAYQNALDATQH